MIDLSYNKIEKQSALVGLIKLHGLNMINLLNNPLMKVDWKGYWNNSIDIHKIY